MLYCNNMDNLEGSETIVVEETFNSESVEIKHEIDTETTKELDVHLNENCEIHEVLNVKSFKKEEENEGSASGIGCYNILMENDVKDEVKDENLINQYDESFEVIENEIKEEDVEDIKMETSEEVYNEGSFQKIKEDANDILLSLRDRSFECRTLQEKLKILEDGRPMPTLRELKKESKGFIRNFNTELYDKTKWLCGSSELKKLFCWPCLLFSRGNTVWNSIRCGYSDLNNLHTAIGRHEKSDAHMTAWIAYKSFGQTKVNVEVDEERSYIISKHNELVKKNRAVLRRLIAVACYLGQQELFIRDDTDNMYKNHGNFVELVHVLSEYDEKLSVHLEQSSLVTQLSNQIQDDIIQSITDVIISEVKREINEAKFVAVLLYERPNATNCSHVSTVFRYVKNETVVERFIGFSEIGNEMSSNTILNLLKRQIDEFTCKDKLVAQTSDGAIMSKCINIHSQLKKLIPEATFVHCFAHNLNMLLAQAVSQINECKVFFATISGLASFFSKSFKNYVSNDLLVRTNIITFSALNWDSLSSSLKIIWEQRISLAKVFEYIVSHPEYWNDEIIFKAKGYLALLSNLEFNFLLKVFYTIFIKIKDFYQRIHLHQMDVSMASTEAVALEKYLKEEQNNFESIWLNIAAETGTLNKRLDRNHCLLKDHFEKLYIEILNIISYQIHARFFNQNSLQFFELLDYNKYATYVKSFPEHALEQLRIIYGKHFDFTRLKAELSVMYASPLFQLKNISELQAVLQDNGLYHGLPELSKLSTLLLTIPSNIYLGDHISSALKRIHSHATIIQDYSYLPGLTIMSIEKEFLQEIKTKNSFYEDVIQEFRKKSCEIELSFK